MVVRSLFYNPLYNIDSLFCEHVISDNNNNKLPIMNLKYTSIFIAFCFLLFTDFLSAQSKQGEIVNVVRKLFDGMRDGDSSVVRTVFAPNAKLRTLEIVDNNVEVVKEYIDDFIAAVGSPHEKIWDERILSYSINIEPDMATAWTEYMFYYGDELMHCGVNAFLFLRLNNEWKISQITDTRRSNCDLKPDSILIASVNSFIDDWHNDASNADVAYFDKIAADGIYIGTDATELWTKDEFYLWSQKYFEKGKAWSFITIERNIYFSDDKQYAWFDELLNTGMGVCRASGVLLRNGDSWEIKHYHLSVAIPNEKMKEVKGVIEVK